MRRADGGAVRKVLACLVMVLGLRGGSVQAQGCSTEHDPATHTKVGEQMPAITVTYGAGNTFSLESQRGKYVVVNFWATWCPPCQFEIPRLENEIWQKYKSNAKFAMIAIAREQTTEEIVPFAKKNGFSFPIASDPNRSTYKLFADSGIPRSYLVDPSGKILFQTVGYCQEDFDRLKWEIDRGLAKASK